jgi:hypothetical protein
VPRAQPGATPPRPIVTAAHAPGATAEHSQAPALQPAPLVAAPAVAAPLPTAPAPDVQPHSQPGAPSFFGDLPAADPFAAGAGGPAVVQPSSVFPPPSTAGLVWPADVPGVADCEAAIARGLAGRTDPPGTVFGAVPEVLANLTALEREVLSGAPQPVDDGPIRRAAVMRVRVAIALATAPAAGSGADAAAVPALLGEIDGLLSEVGALGASAPPELQPALDLIRNALVKEAIDFSEAAHRAQPAERAAEEAPAAAAPRGRAAQARVISVSTADLEIEKEQASRSRKVFVIFVLALLGGAGYHLWAHYTRQAQREEIIQMVQRARQASAPPVAPAPAGATPAPAAAAAAAPAPAAPAGAAPGAAAAPQAAPPDSPPSAPPPAAAPPAGAPPPKTP